MAQDRKLPPIWLMGFGFLPLGVIGAVMLITVPQLLAALHVPEPRIASVEAVGLAPGFLSIALGPLLDWRFSRRDYAITFTVLGAICNFCALLSTGNLALLTVLLFAANMAAGLVVSAVGGWFGNLTRPEDKGPLGAWFTIGNIAGGGVTAAVAMYLLRDLPYVLGAGLISAFAAAVAPMFLWIPCPPADGRLASESIRDFVRDVLALLRKASVLWTLLLFLMPSASFALTNVLSGLGHDYHTPEKLVGLLGGVGAVIAGVVGSLVVPQLGKQVAPRPLYLAIGLVGAVFTLVLIVLPRVTATFGLAVLGENIFQAAAFSAAYIITLRSIGDDNPLAATQFGLLVGASVIPLTVMQVVDGQAYGVAGVPGAYLADGLISGGACVLLALLFWFLRKRIPAA